MRVITKQQKQTKEFFEHNAKKWQKSASMKSNKVLNVINQRNEQVIKTSLNYLPKKSRILDVGCGSGELVIKLNKLGYNAQGIDFSNSMIKLAKHHARKENIKNEIFINDSFFEYKFNKKYDLIAANGFIEYISEKELDKFFNKSHDLLKKNGILVFGSRNRLFNIFSLNQYTSDEMKKNHLDLLINESIIFNSEKNLQQIINYKNKFKIKTNLKKHVKTGINVETRYQYTPFQLIEMLEKKSFKTFDLIPIHIHILNTESRKLFNELHNSISNFLQNQNIQKISMIPQASSFMISARKK